MVRNLPVLALVFLPVCLLPAQQPNAQAPEPPPNAPDLLQPSRHQPTPHPPSPEALRQMAEMQRQMQEHANAINDLAGNIQSLEDAKRLVNLVADEFSKELPPRWMTHGFRERIARAEYAAAAERALIPEEHVADAWNDFLQKIGAPPESFVTAAEIHWLRDSSYTGARVAWAFGNQNVWTVSKVYAIGPDGKVADGCRGLEVLNVLWGLGNDPESLPNAREQMKKGQWASELFRRAISEASNHRAEPAKPGAANGYAAAYTRPPNLIWIAARSYVQVHGEGAFNRAIEGLLKDLFP